jgi:hypothetical protein
MQRHRAGRLAVLLSLSKIDSKPDGVARTACVQPGPQLQGNGRTPSTVGLMAPSASETSMEGSAGNERSRQNQLVSRGPRSRSDATKRNQGEEEDSGLKMNIDITQAANVLRLERINEECSSASDDSGIQAAGIGPPGSKSPNHDAHDGGGVYVCAVPPCGIEPNEAGCDQNCGQDAASRTPSAAQLLRRPLNASNDYLGKTSSYLANHFCVCVSSFFV